MCLDISVEFIINSFHNNPNLLTTNQPSTNKIKENEVNPESGCVKAGKTISKKTIH
jgi:hypothetical protein